MSEVDRHLKCSVQTKLKVLRLYLEGMGLRSIERLEGVSTSLIVKWIRKFSKILKEELQRIKIPEDVKKIDAFKIDELFTYCQKNLKKSMYGLLLIRAEIKLLHLR